MNRRCVGLVTESEVNGEGEGGKSENLNFFALLTSSLILRSTFTLIITFTATITTIIVVVIIITVAGAFNATFSIFIIFIIRLTVDFVKREDFIKSRFFVQVFCD
jgi:uncharacterized membrane-anchored protein